MRLPQPTGARSISARLIAFSLAFLAGTIVIASLILWLIVAGVVREQVDQRLDMQIESLRNALTIGQNGRVGLALQADGPPFDRPGSGWYWQIVGKDVRFSSRSLSDDDFEKPRPPREKREFSPNKPRPDEMTDRKGRPLHGRSLSVRLGDQTLQISVSAPQSALTDPAIRSLKWLVPAMAFLGLLLVVGTYFQVRYGLKPLYRLTSDVAAVSEGRRQTLPEPNVEELKPVSAQVNRLIALNEKRLADARIQFANMAHGLKTPVASLTLGLNDRNDADGGLRQLVLRIDRRIRHHLADARKASVADAFTHAIAVGPRVDDLVLVLSKVHGSRDISVSTDIDSRVTTRCEPDDLDEILGNLLDNAFKWASHAVHIAALEKGSFVEIAISDDGQGMPEEQIKEAFRPGLRLDETVAGSGFGLGIAKEIAELYGGSVSLRRLPKGLEARVRLPAGGGMA